MSRLIVPRGNGIDPPLPVYPIDESSPRWHLLQPDEQQAAARSVRERPILQLRMAAETLCECLGDARRARTGEEWEARRDRLRRVKAAVFSGLFEGRDDDPTRERWRVLLRSRMILLQASRDVAEAAAAEVVEFVFRFVSVCEVPPPRFGNYEPKWRQVEMRFRYLDDRFDRAARSESGTAKACC